jgi:hypothetical protein
MSQKPGELEDDDIPEMELSGGVRGKYSEAYQKGTNVVLLKPDPEAPPTVPRHPG